MKARVWRSALVLLICCVVSEAAATPEVCRVASFGDSVLWRRDFCAASEFEGDLVGVIEGDEAALQKALNLVHRNRGEYVAMLFYASWCPFSRICQPNFQILSSLFPSVPHFAFEESSIRPSILSRYGVHGFPTLFLLNSTVRVRYHGPRTVNSLVAFYNDVTGVSPAALDQMFVEKILTPSNDKDIKATDNCPFSWARSPEKLFQQDTYLALACCFLVTRMLYFLFPKLSACVKRAWRRQIQYATLTSFYEYLYVSAAQTKERLSRLNPCKRSNFQEGAMNAREWASKSLASVSIGETSSGRTYPTNERR